MKKGMKSILSVILMSALFTGAFCDMGSIQKVHAETMAIMELPVVTDFSSMPVPAQASISLPGNTTASPNMIVPVRVGQKGVIEVGVLAANATASIEMCLFSDQSCMTPVGSAMTIAANSTQKVIKQYSVAGEGIYYLRFKWSSSVPASAANIQLQAQAYKGTELSLTEGFQAVYTGNGSSTLYHEVTVKKDGIVTICGNNYQENGTSLQASELTVQFCNSKKKPLFNANLNNLNGYSEYFALKRGKYYVGVSSSLRYQLKSSFVKWKDQAGKSKSKAKLIKKKKTQKGMLHITDGTKKADWFKIKMTKRAILRLNINALCTGTSSDLKIQVIPANRNYTLLNSTLMIPRSKRKVKSRTKLNAGVYYIKVTKLTKSFSGAYSIKYI